MLVIGIGSDVNRAIHPKEKARLQPGPERPGGPRLQTDSLSIVVTNITNNDVHQNTPSVLSFLTSHISVTNEIS